MVSSRSELSRVLGRVQGFLKPKLSLRQYMTPPGIASELLWVAFMNGDIENVTVYDLGCGTGMLTIGAGLLGAAAYGFDIDGEAIQQALVNAKVLGVNILVFESDVTEVKGSCSTVIMNPPFMIRGGKNDRVFLDKAFELADNVYSIHTSQTREWIRKYAVSKGFLPVLISTREFPLPKEFAHQTKAKGVQEVDLWYFRRESHNEF